MTQSPANLATDTPLQSDEIDSNSPRRKRSIGRRVGYSFIILAVLLIIAALLLYFNRNLVYETTLKRVLKSQGYDAALTVDSVTSTQATLKSIALGQDGQVFLRAKSLVVTYDWEELRTQKIVRSMTVLSPTLDVEIDKDGKIISQWMPKSSEGNRVVFPQDGVTLRRGDIGLASPWGNFGVNGDVTAKSLTQFIAKLDIESDSAAVAGLRAPIKASLNLTASGQSIKISNSELILESLTGEGADLSSVLISLDGVLARPETLAGIYAYDGRANLNLKDARLNSLAVGPSEFTLLGHIGIDSRDKTFAPGVLTGRFKVGQARLTDQIIRRDLAKRITLAPVLASTPIAEHFASSFTADIDSLLTSADWSGEGKVEFDAKGYALTLVGPMSAKGSASTVTLNAPKQSPVLKYDATSKRLSLQSAITINGRRDLKLNDLRISGLSGKGLIWNDVQAVSGLIKSNREWTTAPNIRLAPFQAGLNYESGDKSETNLSAAIDYSGPLLGSNFTDLEADGTLTLISGQALSVRFRSKNPIKAKRVNRGDGYEAQNVTLSVSGTAPVFERSKAGDAITLSAKDFTAQILSQDHSQSFALKAQSADIKGLIKAGHERWSIDALLPDLSSETTPGPESKVSAPSLSAVFSRPKNGDWAYTVSGPEMRVVAGPVKLKDMTVTASGSGADFDIEYGAGLVTLKGSNLPPLAVTGTGGLKQGRFEGRAQTALPLAPESPIYADYFYEAGAGGAVLDIPKFTFKPGGVQPQNMAPVLKGKIASVTGDASAKIILGYALGTPITSRGTVTLKDMNIGTLVGPFTGVNTELDFDSLYPLKSSGEHVITMTGFNPGVKLGSGTVRAKVVDGGFDLLDARWPIADGAIAVRPLFWSTAPTAVNTITVGVDDISLGEVFTRLGNESLYATGQISGTLPIVIDGVSLKVKGGRLEVAEGGIIQVKNKDLESAGDKNEIAKIAVTALKELKYEKLTLDVDGPLDGDMRLGIVFTGNNPDVLYGAPFKFTVGVEGELVNIARNLSMKPQIQAVKATLEKKSR